MYCIFVNDDFHNDDEDLNVIQNIKKKNIYYITTRMTMLPYNDVVIGIFKWINFKTEPMVSEFGVCIACLQLGVII